MQHRDENWLRCCCSSDAGVMVGDRWRDVDCARAAGCRAIFIQRGYKEILRQTPDFTVVNFTEAVDAVLRDAGF